MYKSPLFLPGFEIPKSFLFLLVILGKWQHVKETTEIGEGKLFCPGNLRATSDNADYDKVLINPDLYFLFCSISLNLLCFTF